MRGRAGRTQGFTLAEVAIAVAVLTVGLLGAASAITTSINLSRDARDAAIAAQDIDSVRESILGTPYTTLFPTTTPVPTGTAVYAPGVVSSTYFPYHLSGESIRIDYFYYDTAGNEQPLINGSVYNIAVPTQVQFRIAVTWKSSVDGKTLLLPVYPSTASTAPNPMVPVSPPGTPGYVPLTRTLVGVRTSAE